MLKKFEYVTCPYNTSHLILRSRFQVHLVRCRESYPDLPYVVCPFNITHRLKEPELNWHVSICPNRESFEVFKTTDVPKLGPSLGKKASKAKALEKKAAEGKVPERKAPEKYTAVEDDEEENWDLFPDKPSYDPQKYCENAKVLRLPVGLKPSERKAFRAAERERFLNKFQKP